MNQKRWLSRIPVAVCLASIVVVAVVWWQDRGLGVIEDRLASGDAAGALAAVDEFLATHPGSGPAATLRARSLLAIGRPAEAAALFEQVGAAEPKDLLSWSSAWLSLGQWERALPILERLAQLEPSNPETLEAITVCRFELGRRPAAVESAKQLAEIPGNEAKAHLQLASIYREWGYPFEANEHFGQVLRYRADAEGLDMEPAQFFLAYGDSLLASGNARRAIEMLQYSNELEPNPEVTLPLAQAWQLVGDDDKARALFQQILDQDSSRRIDSSQIARLQIATERLAEIDLQQGNFETAIQRLEPLVASASLDSNSAYLLQRAYTARGEESLVRQWTNRTVALRRIELQLAAWQIRAQSQQLAPLSDIVEAYQAAFRRDWDGAGKALARLLRRAPETYTERFVQEFVEAVRQQSSDQIPPIDALPPSFSQDSNRAL